MSTHYIEEAERLADTVAVMAKGAIVARGRPQDLVREFAGQQTHEVYGPPARLEELRVEGERAGWTTRRSGPALAILHAERYDGTLPEGVRRAATLEDAFVVLTGEEIE
jgi:lipooligosaccharide transport system ATP-binding protein